MQIPRPRPPDTGVRRAGLGHFLKNLPGDSDAEAPRKPSENSGGHATAGLGLQLQDAGRSAREPGQAWTPRYYRVRRGSPGREAQSWGFWTRQRTPASTSRQVWARPGPGPAAGGPAPGSRSPARPYRGGGHGGNGGRPAPASGGNLGKEGDRVGWGTVRRPEPSARSRGASRSLQQRRPSQTPRSRRGQWSPDAPPAPGRAGRPPARRPGAPASDATTHGSQSLLTLALPSA